MFNNKVVKTPEKRVDDAISYITRVDRDLGNAIKSNLNQNKSTVGAELSLGESGKWMLKDKRQALRALLLCQRYYLSDLGSPGIKLDSLWNTISINYWKAQGKGRIDEGIRLFTAPCDDAARLVNVAAAAGGAPKLKGSQDYYKLSRNNSLNNIGSGICYMAIMVWLLKSGLVSFSWYLNESSVDNVATLKSKLGPGQQIWNQNQTFTENSHLPNIPHGYIVYINYAHETGYGHWMVSLGNGLGVGCNNNVYAGANPTYSNNASLDAQFYHGFNKQNESGTPQGVAYMFDPTQIPNRNRL
jgi:hypothetical protein